MANTYVKGNIIRMKATFSFELQPTTYFKFYSSVTKLTDVIQLGDEPVHGLQIIADPSDDHGCYVDVDTTQLDGRYTYWFYTLGSYQASGRGSFYVT